MERNLRNKRNAAYADSDYRAMMPFIVLIVLSVIGIIRAICILSLSQIVELFVLLFWLIRNLYFLIMALFLVDGRDADNEVVKVIDAEFVNVEVLVSHPIYGKTLHKQGKCKCRHFLKI